MLSVGHRSFAALALVVWFSAFQTPAASRVTSPKQQFGFNLGDDYHLASYRQLTSYWAKLARESDRLKVTSIGTTEEGRAMVMGIISSPANLRRAERYRDIARRLSHAEDLTDAEARQLAEDGRAIVWISGGLHATETLGAQQLMETVYQLLSRDDAETRRLLDNCIVLAVPANPDGQDLVVDWYMRDPDPSKRSLTNLPRLYQKYIGHDNNRDFYASTQAETKAMNRVMFREWFPRIIYDHHQSGPPGTVMFAPPFRDPFNYNLDPRILNGVDALGAAMMNRFLAEGKPGVTVRSGARYSTWFNGGLRSIGYYHNALALLTETIGSPTPMMIPFNPQLQLPRADLLSPIEPQPWHLRQSIDYSITANYAVLDYASRHRADLLWSSYAMGRDAIANGNRDHWTTSPTRVAKAQSQIKQEQEKAAKYGKSTESPAKSAKSSATKKSSTTRPLTTNDFARFFRDPKERDARGYIVPLDQPDFATATRLINTLLENGVKVHRATNTFALGGKTYAAGSFVLRCNQAYRAHVLDMFEPQDHPNDLQYPGGPPIAPYDIAGWTLAMQMNVKFDRVFDAFSGPFEEIHDVLPLPAGRVLNAPAAAGFLFRTEANDAFRAVNRLLVTGHPVSRLTAPLKTAADEFGAGTFYLPRRDDTLSQLHALAVSLPVTFIGVAESPPLGALSLKPVRIGLWDRFGGSMPSGWTRWLLEKFEFPFQVVYAPQLDAGGLREKFDVLVFVTGAIPPSATAPPPAREGDSSGPAPAAETPPATTATSRTGVVRKAGTPKGVVRTAGLSKIPPEFLDRVGSVTTNKTVPQLRAFLEAGGTVLAIGSSTGLAEHLGLPVHNQLVETNKDGKVVALPREKFYIPGSLVRARVDTGHPLAWGLEEQVDFMFQASPVFRSVPPSSNGNNHTITRVAWFDEEEPLRSGWAMGQKQLKDGLAVVETRVGAGRLVLFGPEIAFRAQPHGTFKFLFNGIVNAGQSEFTGTEQ